MQTIYGALAEGFALFKSEKIKIELGEMSIRQAFIQVKSRSLNENVKEWFSQFYQLYVEKLMVLKQIFLHVKIYRISYGLWILKMSFQTDALSSAYDWLDSHAPQYYWHRAPPIKHQFENLSEWVNEQRKS